MTALRPDAPEVMGDAAALLLEDIVGIVTSEAIMGDDEPVIRSLRIDSLDELRPYVRTFVRLIASGAANAGPLAPPPWFRELAELCEAVADIPRPAVPSPAPPETGSPA